MKTIFNIVLQMKTIVNNLMYWITIQITPGHYTTHCSEQTEITVLQAGYFVLTWVRHHGVIISA